MAARTASALLQMRPANAARPNLPEPVAPASDGAATRAHQGRSDLWWKGDRAALLAVREGERPAWGQIQPVPDGFFGAPSFRAADPSEAESRDHNGYSGC
jgi:hypothetical protein